MYCVVDNTLAGYPSLLRGNYTSGPEPKLTLSLIAWPFILEFATSHKFQYMPSYIIGVAWCHAHASFLVSIIFD